MIKKTCFKNTLYINDNLYVLLGINNESVDLIYLDPPFNSKRMYSAPVGSKAAGVSFKDMWTWQDIDEYNLDSLAVSNLELTKYIASVGHIHSKAMMAYLTYMAQRIVEMHRILKPTGSLYLHCDPTASHYLKIILDAIFGKGIFCNEIIWCYAGGGVSKRWFARKHDVLLFYSKTKKYTYNIQYRPYSEGTVARGRTQIKGKYFNKGLREEGTPVNDWWIDCPKITSPTDPEKIGYPTQKPLVLLNRIISASSNAGDIVLDPFCGCATTCVAAERLGRKWIGIDIEKNATDILIKRLNLTKGLFDEEIVLKKNQVEGPFIATDILPVRTDLKIIQPIESIKQKLYKEQNGLCNACGINFEIRNLEIDHIIPKSKGGGDYYENYQLLCSNCNRIKGGKPMEYLRLKLATIENLRGKIFFGE